MMKRWKSYFFFLIGTVVSHFIDTVASPAFTDANGTAEGCNNVSFGLDYFLPMFSECRLKKHPNGSMVQTIPKLIPLSSVLSLHQRGRIPPGYRICSFPACDKKICGDGCCEETIYSYRCHCSSADKPERNVTTILPSDEGSSLPRDCSEIQTGSLSNISNLSGVYLINPEGDDGEPFYVYCDMETDGGRWTVFQRRQDGSVDFYLYWSDYKHGFGNISSEHWLGSDNIHRLSRQKTFQLRLDLEDFVGNKWYATYNNFSIADEVADYALLSLGKYSGNANDSMAYHTGNSFSTRDRDHDTSPHEWENCAARYKGAWWYGGCYRANLNGMYNVRSTNGIMWFTHPVLMDDYFTLKKTEMKIRPA